MKKKYCKLWIETISLAQADILTMSDGFNFGDWGVGEMPVFDEAKFSKS